MPKTLRRPEFSDSYESLVKRVEDLERISQLPGSGIREGAITIFDHSGNPVGVFGKLPNDSTHLGDGLGPSTNYGFMLYTSSGRISTRLDNGGWWQPLNYLVPASNGFNYAHTNGTYTEAWRWDFWSTGPNIFFDISAFPSAGTCDFRASIYEYGGTRIDLLQVIGANGQYQGGYAIPASCLVAGTGTDAIGRGMTLRMDTRVTSGAGPANCRLNSSVYNWHS